MSMLVSYDKFSDMVAKAGMVPNLMHNTAYFTRSKNNVKVELKVNCFLVGAGLNLDILAKVRSILVAADYMLTDNQPKAWIRLELETMDRFMNLFHLVESVEVRKPKTVKEPKIKVAKVAKEPKAKKVKEPKIKVVDHSASNRLIAKFVASEAGKPYAGTKTVAANGRNIDQGTIDAIKAKNLARLKSVSKKYAPGQVAGPQGPGVPNFNADQARAEVAAMYADMDEEERKRDYPTKLSYTDTEQLTGINPGSWVDQ